MRIRKRFLLSSLSSLPLSDPQLNRSSPLQLLVQQQPQQESNTRSQPSDSFPNPPPSQPSDGNLLIRSAKASWVSSSRPKVCLVGAKMDNNFCFLSFMFLHSRASLHFHRVSHFFPYQPIYGRIIGNTIC